MSLVFGTPEAHAILESDRNRRRAALDRIAAAEYEIAKLDRTLMGYTIPGDLRTAVQEKIAELEDEIAGLDELLAEWEGVEI